MKYILLISAIFTVQLSHQISRGSEADSLPPVLDDAFNKEIVVTRKDSKNDNSISYDVKIFNTKAKNQFSLPGEVGSVCLNIRDEDGKLIAFAPLAFHPHASSKDYDKEYLFFGFQINRRYEAYSFVDIGIEGPIRQVVSRFRLSSSAHERKE